jgi:hypothetical protein
MPVLRINQSGHPKNLGPKKNKPYFFIVGNAVKRHCRIYKGGFLDYTVPGTHWYSTLEEWAYECHSDIKNVAFGFETSNELYSYLMVSDYFHPPNEFLELERVLGTMNLGFDSVAVVHNKRVTMATEFIQ